MSVVALTEIPTGFVAPARDSQHTFRQLLTAMSFPGRLVTLKQTGFDGPTLLSNAAGALLTALPDPSTSVCFSENLARDPVLQDYVKFHTGCADFLSGSPEKADLGWVAGDDLSTVDLGDFGIGTDLEPHMGTTLILDVEALGHTERPHALLALTGPGISSSTTIFVGSLSHPFWQQRINQQALFPLGIDLILTHANMLLALPRTTRIEVIECT